MHGNLNGKSLKHWPLEGRFGRTVRRRFGKERPKRSGRLVAAMPKVGPSLFFDKMFTKFPALCLQLPLSVPNSQISSLLARKLDIVGTTCEFWSLVVACEKSYWKHLNTKKLKKIISAKKWIWNHYPALLKKNYLQ